MLRLPLALSALLVGACTSSPITALNAESHEVHDTGWAESLDPWTSHRDPAPGELPEEDAPPALDTGEPERDDTAPEDEPEQDPPEGALRLVMIDVGQADALLLVGPDGTSMLVDGGRSGSDDEIEAAMAAAGVDRLDYTLASHLHADHIGAMDEILEAHPEVRRCYDHGGDADTATYDSYASAAARCRATLRTGASLDLGPGVDAEILHPGSSGSDENESSLVLRVRFAGVSMLLGGDCPEDGCEERLDPGPIDIYKVHHHGSSSSSSAAFLDRIQPELALISVGNNSYGHPAQDAMDRIQAAGAGIMRSDHHGDVTVMVDAEGWWVE
jgi:competence protein ComEC